MANRTTIPLLFLLWCLHSYFPAQAQTGDLSALLQAKDDTAKVNHLQAYAQTLLDKDNAKAYALFETSTHISQQLGYDRGIANGYRKMGYVHGQEGRYRDAIQYLLTALEYNDKSQAPIKEYLACYNNLGVNYGQLGMGDSTMHYYLFAINKIENRSTTKEEPAARRSILISYCLLLQNVSIVNAGHGNIGKAKEYGQKAIAAAREVNDSAQLTLALVSTANAFYTNKEYDKSLPFIRQAIAAGSSLSNPIPKAKAWRLLSMNYTARAMPDSGIYAAQKALDYSRTTDKQVYLAALMDLSDAYRQKKDHTAEARTLKMAANEFDGLADNLILGNSLYEKLAHAQYNNEAYQEAYDHLWQSGKYKDSLRSRQNQETINKLEIQYQAAQKEKALATQQLALHKSRQQVLIIIALLIVALMAAALLYLRARNKRKLHRQQLTELYQEKEIQLLQALMQGEEKERNRIAKDLHDGVAGMLAAVKMHFFAAAPAHETVQHGTNYKQGMYLLDEAAGELRKISHNLLPEQLLDHGLDEAIRRYCTNISLTGKLEIQYDSWGHIGRYRESFELSVYRIVQELLNNIVKHSKATQAIVQMSLSNNILSITIEDNGIGFNKEQLPGEGMGLHSLASRMQAINGKIELDTSIGNGVNAYLELDTLGLQR